MAQSTTRKLTLPPEARLGVNEDFLDLELVNAANEASDPRRLAGSGGFVWIRESPDQVAAIIDGKVGGKRIAEPLRDMAQVVVDSVDFSWRSLSFYVRHLGTDLHTNSLSIHSDGHLDMRVLIEGHSASWLFDQPEWMQEYPQGLALRAGTAVVLNNLCASNMQLRHGVKTDEEVRSSYLFNFKP